MRTIKARLQDLTNILSSDKIFESKGLGNEINFHVFDYDSEDEYEIRDYLENYLKPKLKEKILIINIYEIIINFLKEQGFLDKIFEFEKTKGTSYANDVIYDIAGINTNKDIIINKIKEELNKQTSRDQIVIITGIGPSYKIIRGHTLLNNLHSVVIENPLIMMYPGIYNGQSFNLFNVLDHDNYYRAFQIVER
ncbi:MAG: DUF1788 domain-containing protein [Bacilli bacterium]|jgi:hypothetical protein